MRWLIDAIRRRFEAGETLAVGGEQQTRQLSPEPARQFAHVSDSAVLMFPGGALEFVHSKLGQVIFRFSVGENQETLIQCNDELPVPAFHGALLASKGYLVGGVAALENLGGVYLVSMDTVPSPQSPDTIVLEPAK